MYKIFINKALENIKDSTCPVILKRRYDQLSCTLNSYLEVFNRQKEQISYTIKFNN